MGGIGADSLQIGIETFNFTENDFHSQEVQAKKLENSERKSRKFCRYAWTSLVMM